MGLSPKRSARRRRWRIAAGAVVVAGLLGVEGLHLANGCLGAYDQVLVGFGLGVSCAGLLLSIING